MVAPEQQMVRGATKSELPGLTGIRGLAALAVVLYHYGVPGFSYGWLSVDVFFVLSGYVLSHVYRDGVVRSEFLWSRGARTIPTHLVATSLVGAAAIAVQGASIYTLLGNLALVDIINPPTWSLIVEWSAYLVFAALAPLPVCRRAPGWPLFLAGYGIAMIGLANGGITKLGDPALTGAHFLRGIGWFAAGVGLHRLGLRPQRTWLLDNRLAVWLGNISYPLYLSQYLPILLWGRDPAWLGIAVSFALAVSLHHAVEAPARRWLRGLPAASLAGIAGIRQRSGFPGPRDEHPLGHRASRMGMPKDVK